MRAPYTARVFRTRTVERVCRDCGYSWTLTRWQARLRGREPIVGGWALMAGDDVIRRSQFRRRQDLVEARAELIARFTHCARCGGSHYSQHRSAAPAPAPE